MSSYQEGAPVAGIAPGGDTTSTVGLLADPGVPRAVAEAIADDLAGDLEEALGGRWTVQISEESLPIDPSGTIPLADRTPGLLQRYGWCHVVYLTDLTQYRGESPIRYTLAVDEPAIVVSVPTVGCLRRGVRVRRLIRDILVASEADVTACLRTAREEVSPHSVGLPDDRVRGLGRLCMLVGMVHSNRPTAMGRALRGCTAVGLASGAFGIFFGSVWSIAGSMSLLRLIAISAFVISALTSWLIVRNGLWTRRRNLAPQSGFLDNASTIATVWIAVLLMHLVLFVGLTALAGVVVSPTELASELGRATALTDYLALGWFSASMGTMAGALGSNFDSEEMVREATYSKRWHQRRLMFDDYGS